MELQSRPDRADARRLLWPSAIVLAAFLGGTGWIAWHRGIWYDEIWSLYFAHHDVSLASAFRERWLQDNHPPTFYLLTWLIEPIVGDNLFLRRMANATPLALAVGAAVMLGRDDRRVAYFAAMLGMLVLASTSAFDAMIEHRSSMTQLSADAVLAMAAFTIALRQEDYRPPDRGILAIIGASILVAFNLHYFSAFNSGVAVAGFLILLWVQGKRRWAARVAILSVLAGLPIAAAFLAERSLLGHTAGTFWAETSTPAAIRHIKRLMGSAYPANIALGLAALATLAARFSGRAKAVGIPGLLGYTVTALVVVATAAVLLVTANAFRPFIVPRYLIALVPFAGGYLVAAALPVAMRHGWLPALVGALSLLGVGQAFLRQAGLRQWDATAAIVSAQTQRCADAALHARPRWIVQDGSPQDVMRNEPAVVRFGHVHVAAKWHVAIEPESSRRIAAHCPTLVWVEQREPGDPAAIAQMAALPLAPEQITGAKVLRGETGFVIAYPPIAVARR